MPAIEVRGRATVLEAPEGGSFITLVDVPATEARDDAAAVAAAWAGYKPEAKWPLKVVTPIADKDGWIREYCDSSEDDAVDHVTTTVKALVAE